ncbi:hypothetical protein LPJ53_003775 [Coemansia erecta]|uniref:ABC transmembrane type-1 domain-containing protein n=1 Tax=Coemansia erecta TaxID=147472 RepID=A0A9W7XVL7_9FUNG|nr:hypothetical protein LPJ53_003775 [Coemansia erecta]
MAQADSSKTYAAAVSGSGSGSGIGDAPPDTAESSDGSQRASEYTEDEYTDDYTESIFSDSNYSGNSSEGETAEATQGQLPPAKNSRPWPPMAADEAGLGLTGGFGSGTSSPPNTAEALAPAHRFVSHTPWGAATGRLTRGQRDRPHLWADPQQAQHTEYPGDSQPLAETLQQQQQQQQPPLADQVVNVVSLQQGSRGYTQLQHQMQQSQQLLRQEAKAPNTSSSTTAAPSTPRIVTIAQFIKSVSRLLAIGFPSVRSTETLLAAALVGVLGVRTALDVWFANFNARCVRAVVTYDRRTLLRRLLPEYLAMTLPMAGINQAIKWVIGSLTIALRVRLGRYAHERYVDGITNITWNQLHRQSATATPSTYERPDWLLTVQIHRFADMLPRLLADVVKPTFDWFVFSRLLSRVIGRSGSLAMVLYVTLANLVIRLSSPPTGKHAGRLAALEEKYRGVYARISSTIQRAAAASTPLVFGNGNNSNGGVSGEGQAFVPRVQQAFRTRARDALDSSLDSVASGVVATNMRRFFGGIGESMLAKYGATLTAYYLLSRPLCTPGRRLASEIMHDPAAVMMSYSRNSAYLINLSQATTRLLLMVGDLPKFVWSTVRVDRLLRSLDVHARYRSAVETMSNDGEQQSVSTE